MAKQPDNRKGPDEDLKGPKQKGKPEPVEDDLEEIEEAAEIVEEPSTPPRKGVPNMSLEENLPQANIVDEAKDVEEADEVIMAEAASDVPPAAAVVDDDLYAEEVPSGPGQKAVAKDALKAEAIEDAEEVEEAEEVDKADKVPEEAGTPLGEAAALDFLTAEDLGDEKSAPGVQGPPAQPADEVEEAFDFGGGREVPETGKPKIVPDSAVNLGKEPTGERPSGVDEVAEALESGVDLHRDAPAAKMPEEEDESSAVDLSSPAKEKASSDIFAEESPTPKAKSVFEDDDAADKIDEVAEEAEEIAEEAEEADEVVEEPEEAAEDVDQVAGADEATEIQDDVSKAFETDFGKAQVKTDDATEVDDEAAKAFEEAIDEDATKAWSGEKAEKVSEAVEDEAREAVSEAGADEEPVVTPKTKADKKKAAAKAAVEDEEDQEEEGRGGTAVARKARKPKYLRRWLGGFLLALILVGGAGAGIWYLAPDLLDEWLALVPASPRDESKVNVIGNINAYKKAKKELAGSKDAVAKLDMALKAKEADLAKANLKQKDLASKISGLEEIDKAAKQALGKFLKDKQKVDNLLSGIAMSLDIDMDKLNLGTFKKIVKEFTEAKTTLAGINKRLEDAKIKEGGEKGVERLLAVKKDIEEKLGAVNKELADAMVKDPGAKGVQQLIASRKKLEADRNDLESAIKTAYQELASAKLAPAKGDPRKQLLEAVKLARTKVESPLVIPLGQLANSMSGLGTGTASLVERTFDLAALLTEVNYYRVREPFVQTPVKQLDTWLALLQNRQFNDARSLDAATKDAAWVRSKGAKANKEAQAKALFVTALTVRNQEKYAEARDLLEETAKEIAGLKDVAWANQAAQALKELTDSSVYYLPRADNLKEQGNVKGALEMLTTGLKAIPGDGRLLARRSLVRLELARPAGKLAGASQKEIRQDAEAARKDAAAAAEAFFALGQLEEILGQWAKAEDDYRLALKAHQGNAEAASRYRIALARMLLMHDRPPAPPEPPAKEKDAGAESARAQERESSLRALLLMVMTGVQPAVDDQETPEAIARLKESIELAKELIKSDNPKTKGQGYMLLGQAYSKQGLRTKGLQEYVKGMQLLNPGIASKDLDKLVQDHPAFQQPDSLDRPNPYLAERHFGKGLHYYWEKKYVDAEDQFRAAIRYFKKDPRYHYYLGLSRLPQKGKLKRDGAVFAFEQGARLELENPQSAYEVNASLERLQGELRNQLNRYRQKGPD